MRLDVARLCLDCDEVHENQECPRCGSEAFGFLNRWVKPSSTEPLRVRPDDRAGPARATPTAGQLKAYRELLDAHPRSNARRLLKGGLIGLAATGLAAWAWSRSAGDHSPAGPESNEGEPV
jgi:hypothetical protein